MCLQKGFRKTTKDEQEGIGWKIFRVHNRDLDFEYIKDTPKIKRNRWIKEKDYRGDSSYCVKLFNQYPYGFHIYLDKSKYFMINSRSKLIKVKYKKAHTIGKGTIDLSVIVAKEILILPNQG